MDNRETCPPHHMAAMEILGKKWTALVLSPLMEGPRRFTDISAYVPGLSDRLLSQRLQELEKKGLIERRVYNEKPVRVEYALSDKGRDFRPVLTEVARWADRWETPEAAATESGTDSKAGQKDAGR